jgi:CDP-2,3-bis-(O-geranylgeranyl)-sn-glycerol synthase
VTIELSLLLLLILANGSPIVVRALLGRRWVLRLDGGRALADGQPLFGTSKTVAGAVGAVLTSTLAAIALGLDWWMGFLIGGLAMLGDLGSSFVKRRLGLRSGAMALGLDQIPESFLPLLACKPLLGLSWGQVLLLTLGFLLADLLISQVFYRLGVGQHRF